MMLIGGTHPGDGAAPLRCSSLRVAVSEALAHFAQRRHVTRQMVMMFIESKYPTLRFSPAALARVLATERQRHAWHKQLANLHTMPYGQLARLSRKLDRLIAEGPVGPQGGQYAWACALVSHVSAELERRAPMNERADPRRVRHEREECLWLVEQDRERRRREQVSQLSRCHNRRIDHAGHDGTGACSPASPTVQQSLFDTATPTIPSAWQLLANLKWLKAEHDQRADAAACSPCSVGRA